MQTIDSQLSLYTFFDRQIAKALEHFYKIGLTENQHLFVCHLSAAMRHGHLCVLIKDKMITPPPETLLEDASYATLQLQEMLIEGAKTLKKPFMSLSSEKVESPLIQDKERYYFKRYWQVETTILQAIQNLANTPPLLGCDENLVEKQLQEALDTKMLEMEQAEAIRQAAKQTVCFITGGPGTGKTHTAGQLIRLLYLACNEETQKRFRLILAAPTGKAATQLETSVLRAVRELQHFPIPQSQTLHRLLSVGGSTNTPTSTVHADCILIDEASMIDAELMSKLLSAVCPGTRLLFLGDADQLPAVDVGSIFSDLLQVKRGIGSSVRLSKSRRTQSPDLLQFARHVQAGSEEEVMHLLHQKTHSETKLHYIPFQSIYEAQEYTLKHTRPFFKETQEDFTDASCLSNYLGRFRLLSPLREGPLGVDALNLLLHRRKEASKVYPLLITRNQPDLDIWNGEMGLFYPSEKSQSCLFLQEGHVRCLQRFQIAGAALGYCVSVHKSQGSEWDEVLLVLPDGSERFGRELLYTAATRAKKRLIILSREETLRKMISRSDFRCSGISERLSD